MKKTFSVFGVLLVLLSFYGFYAFKKEESEPPVYNLISVEITGAVMMPGIYEVSFYTTLEELINYAGGPLKEANTEFINYNENLEANKVYNILFKTIEVEEEKEETLININKASVNELMTLPGLGEVKAKEIVDYREKNGPFKNKEALLLVKGIGEKIYENLKDKITI